jgi:hypothetical protein
MQHHNSPLLNGRTGSLLDSDTWLGCVNEDGTLLALSGLLLGSNLFEVDEELFRVVLGVRQELGRVESEDVVRDDFGRLGEEVGVVCRSALYQRYPRYVEMDGQAG